MSQELSLHIRQSDESKFELFVSLSKGLKVSSAVILGLGHIKSIIRANLLPETDVQADYQTIRVEHHAARSISELAVDIRRTLQRHHAKRCGSIGSDK